MKHLFFVSVALGIFSGTTISANAQASDNLMRLSDAVAVKKSGKFIEGIEIRPGTTVPEKPVVKKVAEMIPISPKTAVKNTGSGIESCSSIQFKYAQLLDMDVESITNYTLYNFIEKWWATTYRYGGTTPKGIDCSAYAGTLLNDVYGLAVSRTSRSQYDACEKIDRENLQEGDLVFFNTRGRRGKGVSHVGVYLRNGYFTHSSVASGVTISNLDEAYYAKAFIGGGRIVENTNSQ